MRCGGSPACATRLTSRVRRDSYADAVALRATQATPILLQVRSDVTRYRYGDEQHLDEALLRIFRINKSGGIRRNQAPVLARLREEVVEGKYALVLGFDSKLPMTEWEVRGSRVAWHHMAAHAFAPARSRAPPSSSPSSALAFAPSLPRLRVAST